MIPLLQWYLEYFGGFLKAPYMGRGRLYRGAGSPPPGATPSLTPGSCAPVFLGRKVARGHAHRDAGPPLDDLCPTMWPHNSSAAQPAHWRWRRETAGRNIGGLENRVWVRHYSWISQPLGNQHVNLSIYELSQKLSDRNNNKNVLTCIYSIRWNIQYLLEDLLSSNFTLPCLCLYILEIIIIFKSKCALT